MKYWKTLEKYVEFSCIPTMSVSSDHSRPYTIGFSIAAILILLIALFHLTRIVFQQIKKCVNRNELGTIVEVPAPRRATRRISTRCVHKLEMVVVCDDEKGKMQHVIEKKKLMLTPSIEEQNEAVNFFAGYTHKHTTED